MKDQLNKEELKLHIELMKEALINQGCSWSDYSETVQQALLAMIDKLDTE